MLNNLSFLTIHCVPCEPKEEFTEATQSLDLGATTICVYMLNTHIYNSKENLGQFHRGEKKKRKILKRLFDVSRYN